MTITENKVKTEKAEPVKAEISADQTKQITRERRAREQTIADLEEDCRAARTAVAKAAEDLYDVNAQNAEQRVAEERTKLKDLASTLAAAERSLVDFNKSFPTDQQIEKRERELKQASANAAYQEKLKAFKDNRLTAYGLLDQVAKLDVEAKTIRVGGMQGDEIANSLVMMTRLCVNRGCEPSSAISIMRGILEKL